MSELTKEKQNLTAQIAELEALQSVYPDELEFTDYQTLANINDFISGIIDDISTCLEYSIKIQGNVDMNVSLPTDYPVSKPDVSVRGSTLNRIQQKAINDALIIFIKNLKNGEPILYDIIIWLQENLIQFSKIASTTHKIEENNIIETILFRRYWILSHHIKCTAKRKTVIDEAKSNGITGFSLIGKPGIICIEGTFEDCERWWQKIKSMIWQKNWNKTH